MNPKIRCPQCGGLFYLDWMTLKHKCPTVKYVKLPDPQETKEVEQKPKHATLINTIIYDDEPLMMYRYFYDLCVGHARTCLLCKSLEEIEMICPDLEKLRGLQFKWLVIKSLEEARRL